MTSWQRKILGIFFVLTLFTGFYSQEENLEEMLTVLYFGSTDIGFCTSPENVALVKQMKRDLPDVYPNLQIKFVLVCLDEDMKKGQKFIRKYGQWDEVSIGAAYRNELALYHLNTSEVPTVPHILVFKDSVALGKWKMPFFKRRALLADLAGTKQIEGWTEAGYPLDKDETKKEKRLVRFDAPE